jgi:hypothetical protein
MALVLIAASAGLGGVAFNAAFSQLPVAAWDSCANNNTCRWSQLNNNNWQPNSGQDPNCYNSCQLWEQDSANHLPYWNGWHGTNSAEEHAVDWAEGMWNGVPENTPSFYKCNCGGTYVQFNGYTDLGPTACAQTTPTSTQSGSVQFLNNVQIVLNNDNNVSWFNGPPTGSYHIGCDWKSVFLHEIGHQYGEGHSSVYSDIMYPVDHDIYSIDQDAHNMLAYVYGYPQSGCQSCQVYLANQQVPLRYMSPAQLAQALEYKVQGAEAAAQAAQADASNQANSEVGWVEYKTQCPGGRPVCPGP